MPSIKARMMLPDTLLTQLDSYSNNDKRKISNTLIGRKCRTNFCDTIKIKNGLE